MIKIFKNLVEALLNDDAAASPNRPSPEQAVAVLMIEVMRADGEVTADEEHAVCTILQQSFALSHTEAAEILNTSQEMADNALDLFSFTSQLNKSFSREQRISAIQQLWTVAFADGELAHRENLLMIKLADLLHISRADFIAAKETARRNAQSSPTPGRQRC